MIMTDAMDTSVEARERQVAAWRKLEARRRLEIAVEMSYVLDVLII